MYSKYMRVPCNVNRKRTPRREIEGGRGISEKKKSRGHGRKENRWRREEEKGKEREREGERES
jgi:hypothetical protein